MIISLTKTFITISPFNLYIVDGGFTAWTAWGACSATCNGGIHTKTRSCTNPVPQNGGRTCADQGLGSTSLSEPCNTQGCPGMCY